MNDYAILVPILFPIIGSLIVGVVKKDGWINFLSMSILFCEFMLIIGTVVSTNKVEILELAKGLIIGYRVDEIGKIFAVLIGFVWFVVGIYAMKYMKHENNFGTFMMMYIMSLGSLISLCYSGNIMTMYFSFEMMTLMTFPLVVHTREPQAIRAGMKYIGYSVLGAGLGLIGFFFLSTYNVSTEFVAGGVDLIGVSDKNRETLLIMAFLMIVGFSCKGGIFPLQGWLPSAHPVAPSPASAVLSGVITKAGVLCVIRVIYYIFGIDFLQGTWVQNAYLLLVIGTIFMGSMLAYKEKILKKRLAYSTISQISYIFFGLMMLNEFGFMGAILQVAFHMFGKNLLFMCAGIMIHKTGKTLVSDYVGIGSKMPKLMLLFTVGTLSLIGIPPTAGFISKWFLAQGGLNFYYNNLGVIGVVILLISAVLTAGYLFSIVYNSFFVESKPNEFDNVKEANIMMLLPIFILALSIILLGIFPYLLQQNIEHIITIIF